MDIVELYSTEKEEFSKISKMKMDLTWGNSEKTLKKQKIQFYIYALPMCFCTSG